MITISRCARVAAAIAGAAALSVAASSCHGTTEPKASSVGYNGGNNQVAPHGTTLPVNPSVIVLNQQFAPVQGFKIIFSVTGGGGSITGDTAISDASGIATVGSWTLGPAIGPNQLTIYAYGLSGSGLTFSATGN
jgi:adhesin/invasin